MKSELVTLTGLWENTDKNGNTYFTGSLNQSVIVYVFKNTDKQKPNHPDWTLKIGRKKPKEEEQQENSFAPF